VDSKKVVFYVYTVFVTATITSRLFASYTKLDAASPDNQDNALEKVLSCVDVIARHHTSVGLFR